MSTTYTNLLATKATFGRAWLEATKAGASLRHEPGDEYRAERFVLTWPDGELRVGATAELEHLESYLGDLEADLALASGDVAAMTADLDRCRQVLFLEHAVEPRGAVLEWIRARRAELSAWWIDGPDARNADGSRQVTFAEPGDDPVPPSPERVARRAGVLAAVFARAVLDQLPPDQGKLSVLWDWLDAHDLWGEADRSETRMLRTDRGALPQQQVVNGSWRAEGLAVLVWALTRYDLPPHDQQADPQELCDAVGLFATELPPTMTQPTLRSPAELDETGERLLGIHWRLRDFSLRASPMDFVAFSNDCWFGSFDLGDTRLIDSDLAIGDLPIAQADRHAIGSAQSIAAERHQAINWLRGWGPIYSRVDTST